MTIAELLYQTKQLSIEDRRAFIMLLLDEYLADSGDTPLHDITELAGVASHLYDGTDAQDYVNALRDEWDYRP